MVKKIVVTIFVLVQGRFTEAAYFYGIAQYSKFTLSLLQLTEKEVTNATNENGKASIQRLAENIANLDPEVILLYTTEEKIQLLMTQTFSQIHAKSNNYTRWIIQGQVRDNFTSPTNGVVLALRQAIVPRRESGKLDQLLLKRLEQIGGKVRDNFTSPTNGVVLALRQAIVPRRESGKLDQLLLKRLEQIGDKVRIGMCVEFCIYCFQ
ncbi:PREDICTED: uncharacterized protein LOC107331697 [Acropora digitifera]|uniref:uncharacterized protein LOC107331695 n=1 Tax=Acropora digitifera TaxID=70779 RepID=UPI00077B00EB|nr:PREDICTED: uncharacterized protein LOC107331695 [Acropora digitifera]XP_015751797.1 PREDICTED: uncharacterized protein LOC107331697 [Acropora digitifera]